MFLRLIYFYTLPILWPTLIRAKESEIVRIKCFHNKSAWDSHHHWLYQLFQCVNDESTVSCFLLLLSIWVIKHQMCKNSYSIFFFKELVCCNWGNLQHFFPHSRKIWTKNIMGYTSWNSLTTHKAWFSNFSFVFLVRQFY